MKNIIVTANLMGCAFFCKKASSQIDQLPRNVVNFDRYRSTSNLLNKNFKSDENTRFLKAPKGLKKAKKSKNHTVDPPTNSFVGVTNPVTNPPTNSFVGVTNPVTNPPTNSFVGVPNPVTNPPTNFFVGVTNPVTNPSTFFVGITIPITIIPEPLGPFLTIHSSHRCEIDENCGPSRKCLTSVIPSGPPSNYCYQCIIDDDCDENEICTRSSSSLSCSVSNVKEPPSLYLVEYGYNIYKGDPLNLSSNEDTVAPVQFYNQIFEEDPNQKINLQGEDFYHPLGIEVKGAPWVHEESVTRTITSSSEFEDSQSQNINFGGDGTVEGVDIGATAGIEQYYDVSTKARNEVTTSESSVKASLYTFSITDKNYVQPTEQVQVMLNNLKTTNTKEMWSNFFDNCGTHIIIGGRVGATKRFSNKYTRNERSALTQEGKTFTRSLSIGIPTIFGFSMDTSDVEANTVGDAISEVNTMSKSFQVGDPDNLLNDQGVVERTLEPICDFINAAQRNDCNTGLIQYCVQKIRENVEGTIAVGDTDECKIPQELFFDCAMDEDCGNNQICINSRCGGNCRVDENCGDFQTCNSNECTNIEPTLDACTYQMTEYKHNCGVGATPSCRSRYEKIDTSHHCCCNLRSATCRREWRAPKCHPHTAPLKGTCGNGIVGNGCCNEIGASCSSYGFCGWGQEYQDLANPNYDDCKEMMVWGQSN